jgi:hypothetical protein
MITAVCREINQTVLRSLNGERLILFWALR